VNPPRPFKHKPLSRLEISQSAFLDRPSPILQIIHLYKFEDFRRRFNITHSPTYQMLRRDLVIGVSFVLFTQVTVADYKDTVRHTELVNELSLRGISAPTGVGVSVTQVEGGSITNYIPNVNDAEFSGKTINPVSGPSGSFGHATTVGKNLYGNSTSIAPGITSIDGYQADDWLNNLGWYGGTPSTETNPLQNHSYIAYDTTNNGSKRMDYAVLRDGFLPIAGLNNGSGTAVPAIYGSIYNGITVGLKNGGHSRGGTVYDTAGRTKPEIVSDHTLTSYATPHVTAAAALLIEAAGSDADAKEPLTLKAILLAGADKSPFASWDQTTTRPIDDIYGAGLLDVYENYFIQQAGQQVVDSNIDERGWNITTLARRGSDDYNITVPSGFELRNLSALVTWNRSVNSNLSASLANLSLSLTDNFDSSTIQSSNSAVDNIEHIWRDSSSLLTSGSYTLTVAHSANSTVDYAIAWRSELYQDYTLWSVSAFTTTPIEERDATDDPDGDGIKNLLEQAFGGDPESMDLNILPIGETIDDIGERYLQISYRKPNFDNGLIYTVETVTDLKGTWTSQSSEVELISIAPETGGFDRYTYRLVDPVSAEAEAYLRVSISQ
jgi:hypothetical protein